jgi:hypothetical protein
LDLHGVERMKNTEIYLLTKKLLSFNHEIMQKFEETKESGMEGDFYREIKPFSDLIKGSLENWSEKAIIWIRDFHPKNLHAKQIESVIDQLEMISVQAFFPQTSRARFVNTANSVEYVLKTLLLEIEKAGDF